MNMITPLHAYDVQAAFDTMVRHLANLPAKAANEEGECCYRADLTPTCPTRCVIGALIPDDQYTPDLEGLVPGGHDDDALPFDVSDSWSRMADNMQAIHDDDDNWGSAGFVEWGKVREVAAHHDLSAAVIDEVASR